MTTPAAEQLSGEGPEMPQPQEHKAFSLGAGLSSYPASAEPWKKENGDLAVLILLPAPQMIIAIIADMYEVLTMRQPL